MPSKKRVKGNETNQKKVEKIAKVLQGESYLSLILGVVVVVVASILLIGVVKNRSNQVSNPEISSDKTETVSNALEKQNSYTVVDGDTLWSISEKVYKTGFEWEKIAKANKLENPGIIESGTKLIIPQIETKVSANKTEAEKATNAISGSAYKVVEGDDLWDIAVRAYGDGYKWTEIAKANNLDNPDIIHSGNELKLPR